MTRTEAMAAYQDRRWEEEVQLRNVLFATPRQLRVMAETKRSTASALEVLASFALDEGDL